MNIEQFDQIVAKATRLGEVQEQIRIVRDLINDAVISMTIPVTVLERIVNIIENKRESDEQPDTL